MTVVYADISMRIAVVSDIHSNLPALEAVVASLGDVDRLWILGDIVGYGAEPDGVVERLRDNDAVAVRGNHDHVATGAEGADWFNVTARSAIEWTADTISPSTRGWLSDLPIRREEQGFTLVHGSPRDPLWEYIDDPAVAGAVMPAMTTAWGLFGHTHRPRAFVEDNAAIGEIRVTDGTTLALGESRVLLNPGSVGQPRDGDPRAAYLVLDTEQGRVTWHRVAYDVALAARRIRAAGLPERLAGRLALGV